MFVLAGMQQGRGAASGLSEPAKRPQPGGTPLSLTYVAKALRAEEDGSQVPCETEFSDRLRRLGAAKAISERVAAWGLENPSGDRVKLAEKVAECGGWLVLREYLEGGRGVGVTGGRCCQKSRLCALCAGLAARRRSADVIPRLVSVRFAKSISGGLRRLLFFTGTAGADEVELAPQFARVLQGVVEFARGIRGDRARKRGALAGVVGGLGSIEIKRGKGSGLWHTHYHGLYVVEGDIDFGSVRRRFLDAIRGRDDTQCRVEWARAEMAFPSGCVSDVAAEAFIAQVSKNAREVTKYVTKFSEVAKGGMSESDVWEVFEVTRGKRLFHSLGELRGCVTDELFEDVELATHWRNIVQWIDGAYSVVGTSLVEGGQRVAF